MIWLAGLWARMRGWFMAAAVLAAAFFAAWLRGRSDGRRAAEREQYQDRLESIREAKEIDHEVDALGDDDLDRRFNRWVRKP